MSALPTTIPCMNPFSPIRFFLQREAMRRFTYLVIAAAYLVVADDTRSERQRDAPDGSATSQTSTESSELRQALNGHAAPQTTLRAFQQNSKWGYKNAAGEVIVEPRYDIARRFSCGRAAVNLGAEIDPVLFNLRMKRGGVWGFIDTTGKVVVPIKLQSVHDFSEGLAQVRDCEKRKFLNILGETVFELPEDCHSADNFSEGLVPVRVDRSSEGNFFETRYFDKKGRTVFSILGYGEEFQEGLARFSVPDPSVDDAAAQLITRSGFINRSGKTVIKPVYWKAKDFSEGLAAVRRDRQRDKLSSQALACQALEARTENFP